MPVGIRVEFSENMKAKIRALGGVWSKAATRAGLADYGLIFLREAAIVSKGSVRRGWVARLLGDSEMLIGNRSRAANFVETGTRAHMIYPRRRKALRWRKGGRGPLSAFRVGAAGAAGNFNFATKVVHPGTVAQRPMERTLKATLPRLLDRLSARLEERFRALDRGA